VCSLYLNSESWYPSIKKKSVVIVVQQYRGVIVYCRETDDHGLREKNVSILNDPSLGGWTWIERKNCVIREVFYGETLRDLCFRCCAGHPRILIIVRVRLKLSVSGTQRTCWVTYWVVLRIFSVLLHREDVFEVIHSAPNILGAFTHAHAPHSYFLICLEKTRGSAAVYLEVTEKRSKQVSFCSDILR